MEELILKKSFLFSHRNEPRPNLHFGFKVYKYLFLFEAERAKEGEFLSSSG